MSLPKLRLKMPPGFRKNPPAGVPIQDLDGLFYLWRESEGGHFHAILGPRLEDIYSQLHWGMTAKTQQLGAFLISTAIFPRVHEPIEIPEPQFPHHASQGHFGVPIIQRGMSFARCSNVFEIYEAGLKAAKEVRVCHNLLLSLHKLIGDDVSTLTSKATPGEKAEAGQRIIQLFNETIDVLNKKPGGCRNENSKGVPVKTKDRGSIVMPLAWAMLKLAPDLVAQLQRLPTKKELRSYVQQKFPRRKFSDGKWSSSWKQAGLETLPRSERFLTPKL